jgi:hypothetical protein
VPRRGRCASSAAAQMTNARNGMSMYARAARNGKSKRVHRRPAAISPTRGVNACRASRYIPAASATNDAKVAATITRSPCSPRRDSRAPNAIASGCSVGAR